jgi:hypothetical protein
LFYDAKLQEHLETSSSVKNRSFISAEWNMNVPDNIKMVGNYRYRKDDTTLRLLPVQFDENDATYKNGTNSDTTIENGFDDNDQPIKFSTVNEKEKLYFSLDDCLGKFRPRSGINKARYFTTTGTHFVNGSTINGLGQSYLDTNRPRYYAADRNDKFKYWTSFRTEFGKEYGVANKTLDGLAEFGIDDVAPFVVYKEAVPANRIVVKMQTNIGTIDQGNISTTNGTIADPLFGASNKTTPVKWKVQGLVGNDWEDLKSFDSNSTRRNGSAIIGADGYVELSYGLIVPDRYRDIFIQAETYSTEALLPIRAVNGYAYLIKTSATDIGEYHIWIEEEQEYQIFTPEYGWTVAEETVDRFTHFVTDTTRPDNFVNTTNQFRTAYREMQYLRGIRIVVETMNKLDSTFDLIEMSTRLAVNITDKTKGVSAKKSASDLGISGLPVGQLLVSTGSIEIFDFDDSFNVNNASSIIARYAPNQIQFKIYDVIAEVLDGGTYYDYFVPIKTMYGDGFPEVSADSRTVRINLRDMFSYFESFSAPQILVRNASLTYAVSFLLDNIGFSNYIFKRVAGESEPIIPFFYVEPDVTVAEVLNELARSTQTAMFFDEYNNFVMMSKNYMLPKETDRGTDITLYGSKDFAKSGVERNSTTKPKLANIISIASQDTEVYNDGKINFTTRYIEKSYSSLEQANKLDRDKNWTYKPSLLWEVSPSEATKTQNSGNDGSLSTYALTAIPLKTTLPATVPYVDAKGQVQANIIDFGDAAQWMGRYAGYFYANGEVIRYDAVQYKVLGQASDVWISSLEEYEDYFSKIPFNGKMYPTGFVRIYSKPFYNKTTGLPQPGVVEMHGRAQFGTKLVEHKAGLDIASWTQKVSGVTMDSDYLFSAIGNFQLRDAYIPHKADIPIKTFGSGSRTWTLTAPGTLSVSSGTGDATPTATNIRSAKEYKYSLSMNSVEVYAVTQSLQQKNNVDKTTTIGNISISNIVPGSTTSAVTLQVTLPSFKSFYKNLDAAKKSTTDTYSWSIVGTTVAGGNNGTIFCKNTGTAKKPVYDANKTWINQGTTAKVNASTSATSTIALTTTVTNGQATDITLVVNGNIVKTITINTSDRCGVLGDLSNVVVAYDNRTISVEDTSGIKVGQEVILYTKDESLSASGTDLVVSNPFDTDNKNMLRVASIQSDTLFKIKRKGDTSSPLLGITDSNLKKDIKSITFKDQRFVSSDATKVAGGKTNESGNRDSSKLGQGSTITGVIKNFLSAETSTTDNNVTNPQTVPTGSVQSSALVMSGPAFTDANDPDSVDFVSYAYKNLGTDAAKYKYFGTRLRIIGKYEYGDQQSGIGEDTWYTNKQLSSTGNETTTSIKASSGGIAVLLNPVTNNGYYFEIAAISDTGTARKVVKYSEDGKQLDDPIHNLLFYKMNVGVDENGTLLTGQKATPVKLWGGLTNVSVDNGSFVGQSRMSSTNSVNTVYDLAVEYEVVNENSLRFYLYVNNVLVGTVTDADPFIDATTKKPIIYNNMALFVRGKAKCMFEHVFAISASPSQTASTEVVSAASVPENGIFGSGSISFNESMRKYALSGIINESFLSGVSPSTLTSNSIYYEEFGTIMREAAYFNVRYDKSYPALTAQIAPTYNNNRGYTISGFLPGPYSAEFMVFNSTDSVLVLDGSEGNYLRLQGITFTQQATHELTVDEYFSTRSSLSDPQTPTGSSLVASPLKEAQEYNRIRNSRSAYGKKEFTLESRYIQNQDMANSLMEWITGKIMKPRKSVGVSVFSMPTLQLGDIVNIDMKDENGVDQIAPSTSRFVVYQIDYSKSSQGPEMSVYLSEVV